MTDTVTIVERMPRVVHNKKWDDEKIERLRCLVAAGMGETTIARQFTEHYKTPFTRNAIIGARFRYKIACSRSINKPKRTKEQQLHSRSAMTKIQHRRAAGNQGVEAVPELVEPEPAPHDLEIPMTQRCTLLELDKTRCHWPVGSGADLFFCGAAKPDGVRHPYCAHYAQRGTDPRLWRGVRNAGFAR